MIFKIIANGVFFFLIVTSCNAQKDQIDEPLRSFLVEMNETPTKDYKGKFYVVNILDKSSFDSTKNGIYKFGMLGAHSRPFLFLYEDKKVNIIRNYSVANVLEKLILYYKRNDSNISTEDKIKYLENIIHIIKKNQFPSGYIKLEGDIENK
jgi:hypothetical protein